MKNQQGLVWAPVLIMVGAVVVTGIVFLWWSFDRHTITDVGNVVVNQANSNANVVVVNQTNQDVNKNVNGSSNTANSLSNTNTATVSNTNVSTNSPQRTTIQLKEEKTYPLKVGATNMVVVDSVGYISVDLDGILTYDLKNPPEAKLLGSYKHNGFLRGLTVINQIAYFADTYKGLYILNMKDPAHPQQLSSLLPPTYQNLSGLAVINGYAYLPDAYKGFYIISIGDITKPQIVDPAPIKVQGGIQFITGEGPTLVVLTGTESHIYDITNATKPILVKTIPVGSYSANIQDNKVYLNSGTSGISVIDVADPKNPTVIVQGNRVCNCYNSSITGNQLWTTDGGSNINIIDVSDPKAMSIIGTVNKLGIIGKVVSIPGYALALDYKFEGGYALRVFQATISTQTP